MKKVQQSKSIDAEREHRYRKRDILDYQTDKLITFQKTTLAA